MSGRVVHFEIPFDDSERASRFYTEAFGWTLSTMPEVVPDAMPEPRPDPDYLLATTGPSDQGPPSEPGFVNGGLLRRESPVTAPVLTIDVEDIETALAEVERLGGATVSGRRPVGELGFAAYVTDSEGNLLGLWQDRLDG